MNNQYYIKRLDFMRYILKISYDGEGFAGYQKQNNAVTIQETLEGALSKVLGESVETVASGRTDAGVSAIEQTCHFDYEKELDSKRVIGYANSLLPRSIRVLSIEVAEDDFHARFSAHKKTYEYYFYTSREILPHYERIATLVGYNLDITSMKNSCEYFLGEHDFSAFCASNTSVTDKVRTIYALQIVELGEGLYKLVITGNGFLYNMVRIIMGTLVEVGLGKIKSEDLPKIIESCDRKNAGKTISAKGLCLKKVIY